MTSLHGRPARAGTHRRGRWTETHLPLHGGNLEPPRLRYPGREQAGCNVAKQLVASPGVRHVVMGRSCLSTKSSCSMHSGAGGQSGPGPHCSGLPSCSRPAGDRRALANPGGKEDHGQERDAGLVANRPPRRPSIGPVRWESIRQIPRTTMLEPVSTNAGPSATTSRCSCGFLPTRRDPHQPALTRAASSVWRWPVWCWPSVWSGGVAATPRPARQPDDPAHAGGRQVVAAKEVRCNAVMEGEGSRGPRTNSSLPCGGS
jgi:hypothetical protein